LKIKQYIERNYPSRRQFALDWGIRESTAQGLADAKKEVLVIQYGHETKIVSVLKTKGSKVDQMELGL
jgi:hypothetical protein